MTSSLKDNFCSSPWFHIRINPEGNYVPCRWDFSLTMSSYNVKNTSLSGYMNSEVMKSLRMDLLDGKSSNTCQSCRNDEQYGKVNGRQRQLLKSAINLDNFEKTLCASPHWNWFDRSYKNQGSTDNLPVDLQIDLGNTCNSACIMCYPISSSRLITDYKKLHKIEPLLFYDPTAISNWTDDPILVDKFVDELAGIPDIKYIHFLGGETLYLKSFYTICNKLIERDIAKNVSIGTTTNCTVYTPELENIIKNFKHVHLGLSVEAIHPINNYVRWPSQIDNVVDVMKKFIALRETTDLHLSLRITPSVLTISHIDTLFEFMIENSVIAESCNLLQDPSCLKIELLTTDLINHIVSKIDKIIAQYQLSEPTQNLINRRNDHIKNLVIADIVFEYKNLLTKIKIPNNVEDERYNMVKFIKAFESIRNNKILDYLPEYEEFLRSYDY
jgi:MoaA/NifB/PqqE/SkfB family radical SAM enzyme